MTPEEHEQELERLERELRQRETELRLRELESAQQVQLYKTTKVRNNHPETPPVLWKKRVVLGLKLFGVGVVAIALVRVASVVANLLIVGTLLFVGYKVFFDKKK